MTLYQEIILLQYFAPKNQKWVIENVVPYYDYLIKPSVVLGRHPFWSNFKINYCDFGIDKTISSMTSSSTNYGVNLNSYKIKNKRQILRNMVNTEVGKYILDRAMDKPIQIQGGLF